MLFKKLATLLLLPALFAIVVYADTTVYNDQADFFAATGTKITDN